MLSGAAWPEIIEHAAAVVAASSSSPWAFAIALSRMEMQKSCDDLLPDSLE